MNLVVVAAKMSPLLAWVGVTFLVGGTVLDEDDGSF